MAPVILAIGEVADGALTLLSTEIATLARQLADQAGGSAVGLVVDAAPDGAAAELADIPSPGRRRDGPVGRVGGVGAHAAAEVRRLAGEWVTHVLVGATTDGRDLPARWSGSSAGASSRTRAG